MATNNITFPIYNADGTPFNGLVLRNATFDSVVMSLGDKITGDVYYKDNTLAVTMSEYIEYKRNEDSEAVRFVLVNPPTVVREGIVSDNSELRGMTKYSFVFYHPMYAVSNFPFTDVAVSSDEQKYLSNSKTFNWIGNLFDMVAKLNKNLQGTQWIVGTNIEHYEQDGVTETSMWQKAAKIPDEPLSFDKTYVSEVLKTSYETWEIPFIVDQIAPTDALYAQGKRFLILFGTPSNEILDDQDEPYIFRFGQGVGLKNNSRTPKNNKIVTRIVGYGSENNIPFGYPQIQWFGDQTWKYTVNNDLSAEGSLPIYKGILGGQYVNLIKHPFTRKTLMPSVYRETLFNKVSPYMPDGTPNPNFDPTIELVDYYDADGSYINPVVEGAESVEIHQFDDIKPEFTEHSIVDAFAYDSEHEEAISYAEFIQRINSLIASARNENEIRQLTLYRDSIEAGMTYSDEGEEGGSYTWHKNLNTVDEYYMRVRYTSDSANFNWLVVRKNVVVPATQWDDTMDDDGNYKQSYFKMTLPQLDFDLYACASITEEMKINMRSGACIGCTFDIAVDWDDYKKNFYDSDGNFVPDGEQRDLSKYPKTNLGQVTFVVKKDLDTFGTLMPNTYQQPHSGDEFVILGISLPTTYVTNAEARLDDAAKEYMRENNVHYYEYPLKFDEHFLATHTDILSQIRNNTIVRFQYGGELPMALYVKQMTIKYSGVLPTYDITLTDDVEIVLNQIGQVTDDVSRMRVQVSELQKYYSENIIQAINEKLSKVVDDVCQGRITFQQGLDSIGSAIFHDELRSPDFTSGLYTGHGWRIDQLGNAEFESIRARSFLEVVELLVNRMQAQEGDTLFTDNDQIDKVEEKTYNGTTYYKLSLKKKWDGYVTSQKVDNIIKGIINTLAAKDGNVSDVTAQQSVESDGVNKYYTSWMKVINPSSVNDTVATNQICVILYGDASVPAGKNFKPCELMTIARWGCDADPYASGITTAEKESIIRRQNSFVISATDGRIAKLRGVRTPILQAPNYGTTLGTIPEFIKSWSIASRLIEGRDYLYAQGIIVGDFIKVDALGNPQTNYVDCGNWQNGTQYFHEAYNSTTLQWETSDVWHNGSYWRCLVSQPYNGTYYEPTDANSQYWQKLLVSGDSIQEQAIYKWAVDKPSTPTETSVPPTGWNLTPDYKWHLGGIEDDDKIVVRIPIDVKNSGASIVLKADASSEQVDYTILGKPDDNILETASSDEIISLALTDPSSLGNIVSGTSSIRRTTFFSTTGLHFICIAYVKDSSFSAYNDCGIVSVVSMDGVEINMHLWRSVGELVNGNLSGTWSEPVQASAIDGEDGLNGESAPYYFQEWFAWSNDPSTSSVITPPTISGSWATSIPAQGSYAYLWRKSIRFVWNESTRQYTQETAQYFRMSGTNGTSISVKGNVTYAYDSVSDFPSPQDTSAKAVAKSSNTIYTRTYYSRSYHWTAIGNASDGDAYTVDSGSFGGKSLANHLIMWSSEANEWLDLGQFKGESGKTYYTHIAWATNVNYNSSGVVTRVDGFTIDKSPNDTTHLWMGVLVNEDSGTDSSAALDYTWSYTKGVDGFSVQAQYAPNNNPSSSQIHNTWQNGDIYMRTKQSNETNWSSWNKIVGENGGETDYSFNISKEKTSASATDAPSNCYYNTWQGAPISPTSTYPYLWMKIQKKDGDGNNVGDASYARVTGEKGDKGQDGVSPQPNILLRTIFDDGIDKVKEAWSSDWTVTSIDAATDTIVEGRKSLRINMANGQTGDCDLFQVVFGKLEASTWYTVSFNYFATQAWNTFLHSNVESHPAYYDASAGIIIDGVMQTMSDNNGTWQWPADWTGQRHTMTFKTASDLSGIWDNSQLLFRVPQGCQLALCMPKLEIGQVATAYMANEDDLKGEKGDQGDRGKVGRFFYFAGTFNPQDDDPTHVFVVNDAQAPYFEHTETVTTQSGTTTIKRYHVFNYDTNGTYTMAQMWSISSKSWNNAPWEVMTNDFKYLITEAIFARFAQFGSAIINGDWMISQHGTVNGAASQDYTKFDPNHPTDNYLNPTTQEYNFIPNFAIDLLNGQTILNSQITRFRDIVDDYIWYPSGTYIVAGWGYTVGVYSNIVTNVGSKTGRMSIIFPMDVSFIGKTFTIFESTRPSQSSNQDIELWLEEKLRYNTGIFYGLCKLATSESNYWESYTLHMRSGTIEFVGIPSTYTDANNNEQPCCGWLVKSRQCGLLFDQRGRVYDGL